MLASIDLHNKMEEVYDKRIDHVGGNKTS